MVALIFPRVNSSQKNHDWCRKDDEQLCCSSSL